MEKLSVPLQEYLEALWVLQVDESRKSVKTGELSSYLKVQPASATEVLGKLSKMGLVSYKPYYGAALTATGLKKAEVAIRCHRLAEKLLVDVVGMPKEDVEDAACGLEHHLDGKLSERICKLLKHPEHCPHGKKIPEGKCCKASRP